MIKLEKDLQLIAKREFTTEESIIKKGLKIFLMYKLRTDYQEFLEEHTLEECIAEAMKQLGMTRDEILFASLDSYKAIVLEIPISERKIDYDYCYRFITNTLAIYKIEKEPTPSQVLEQNRISLIQEQESIIDLAISKAQEKLTSKNKEVAEVQAKVSKIESEISKINSKILLLKSKDILTITPSQRANNRRDITQLETKSTTLIKELQELKDELKQIKNERFYIQEDISAMIEILENPNSDGYYEVSQIKDQYR